VTDDTGPEGALSALTILDLSEGIAGPCAAKLFADYGARVIKVERPARGDRLRSENDARFQYLNTNKESITLDYETVPGALVLSRLIEDADGLIEDGPTRRSDVLGLGASSLLDHVPRLVICRVSAFADPSRSYEELGGVAAEYRTGLHAFAAALAALWHASQSEHGQVVEVTGVAALASATVTGAPPGESVEPIRDMVELPHPTNGTVVTQRGPFELSETLWRAGLTPALGQHTDEVLGEIEVDATAIEALRREGVV